MVVLSVIGGVQGGRVSVSGSSMEACTLFNRQNRHIGITIAGRANPFEIPAPRLHQKSEKAYVLVPFSQSALSFGLSPLSASLGAGLTVLDSGSDDGVATFAASSFRDGSALPDGCCIIMGGFLPGCVVFSDTGDYDVLEIGAWVALQD